MFTNEPICVIQLTSDLDIGLVLCQVVHSDSDLYITDSDSSLNHKKLKGGIYMYMDMDLLLCVYNITSNSIKDALSITTSYFLNYNNFIRLPGPVSEKHNIQ